MSREANLPAPTPAAEKLTPQLTKAAETIQSSTGAPATTDNRNVVVNQFLTSPLIVHDQVNPRKPILAFDGSNYAVWQAAIDRTMRYVSGKDGPFVAELASVAGLPGDQSRALELVIRNTIDPNLLDIVDSRQIHGPVELCDLLIQKCQPMARRLKLNVAEQLIGLLKQKTPVSEQWIVDWHKIYSGLNQLNVSRDELIGLLFQASLSLPAGTDPVPFDFLANQRLQSHGNPSFDNVSTVLSTTLFDLRVKVAKSGVKGPAIDGQPTAEDAPAQATDWEEQSTKDPDGSMCHYCQDKVWDALPPGKDGDYTDDSGESDPDYVPRNAEAAEADQVDDTT